MDWSYLGPGILRELAMALPWIVGLVLVLTRPTTGSWRPLAVIGCLLMVCLSLISAVMPLVSTFVLDATGYWMVTSLVTAVVGFAGGAFVVAALVMGRSPGTPPASAPPFPRQPGT